MAFNRIFSTLLSCCVTLTVAFSQPKNDGSAVTVLDASSGLTEIATLPKHIKESSGLEITSSGTLWTHNDGGVPILFGLDSAGNVVKTIQLNHPNSGWEDVTIDSKGNLYVGSFGNNKNDKKQLKIYKIGDPETINEKVVNAEIIKYSYADQNTFPATATKKNFDMDAMAAFGDSIYLFTKNRTSPFTGYCKIYSVPQVAGEYSLSPVDSLYINTGNMMDSWVTAADISPDGKTLALLSHQYVWLIKNFTGNRFSTGKIFRLDLKHFSHKAGLCFSTNSMLYISDELEMGILGGKIYQLDLEKVFKTK
jgi:hypothetical protein